MSNFKFNKHNLELSPNHQYLLFLMENDPEEADRFEARFSPFEGQPIEPYKETLIKLGYITSSGLINKLKKAPVQDLGDEFDTLVDNLRKKFQGKKLGAMGDKSNVRKKLADFKKKHPDFTDEIIIQAADKYVRSQMKDNYKFLMQLDYFISKVREDGTSSMLSSICEEIVMGVTSVQGEKPTISLF
jgi:hypothetical protein